MKRPAFGAYYSALKQLLDAWGIFGASTVLALYPVVKRTHIDFSCGWSLVLPAAPTQAKRQKQQYEKAKRACRAVDDGPRAAVTVVRRWLLGCLVVCIA